MNYSGQLSRQLLTIYLLCSLHANWKSSVFFILSLAICFEQPFSLEICYCKLVFSPEQSAISANVSSTQLNKNIKCQFLNCVSSSVKGSLVVARMSCSVGHIRVNYCLKKPLNHLALHATSFDIFLVFHIFSFHCLPIYFIDYIISITEKRFRNVVELLSLQ